MRMTSWTTSTAVKDFNTNHTKMVLNNNEYAMHEEILYNYIHMFVFLYYFYTFI